MVRAPLHFHGRIPVPEVAPLTYRDGVSQLELVYELSEYLKNILHPSLQSTVDQVVSDAEQLLSDATAQYVDGVEEFQRIHDAFMSDVNANLIALNDGAVSDLVEDNTSLLGQILRRTFEPYGEVHRVTDQVMGEVTPVDDSFLALQDAATRAAQEHKTLVASGHITTDQTLYINSDCDLSRLHITYTGNTVAVHVGEPSRNTSSHGNFMDHQGHLPHIQIGHKILDSWDMGTIGLRMESHYSCVFTINNIHGFAVGLDVVGDANGYSYNTLTIKHLSSNKINMRLRGINNGWVNQNTFIGGRYSHISQLGEKLDDCSHIQLVPSSNPINNNTWINPSVEGWATKYNIEVSGTYNMFLTPRFESPKPEVLWDRSGANQLLYGFNAQNVEHTQMNSLGTGPNHIQTHAQTRTIHASLEPVHLFANTGSGSGPVWGIYQHSNYNSPLELYNVLTTPLESRYKGANDEHPRMMFRHESGQIRFGDGESEPSFRIGSYGSAFGIRGFETGNAPYNQTEPREWVEIYVDGAKSYMPVYR